MTSQWFSPHRHADRRAFLLARAKIMTAIRAWFAEQGFLEVDVPALAISPGNETHLHAFATELINPDASRVTRYLHTSPEFACKKLLAAGEEKIFSLQHVFRNRERTPTHTPEFTMLEWYRTNESFGSVVRDALEIIALASTNSYSWKGRACDPFAEPQWLSVADAFQFHAGVDLLATIGERDALARQCPVRISADDTWSDIFSRILVERIEPELGNGRITVLYDYPISEAALARPSPLDSRVAERFELYACGVELANGFGELTDAAEQRRRFEEDMDLKQSIYGERYPIDEELLQALAIMPESSGVAMGLDRLVMLATGARSVEEVQWVPVP
jgi:lysyl-tRNA synthetase class 2